MKLLFSFFFLLAFPLSAQQRPSGDVNIVLRLGEVALIGDGKLSVLFAAAVSKTQINEWLSLSSSETLGGTFQIGLADLEAVSKSLEGAANSVDTDTAFSQSVSNVRIVRDAEAIHVIFRKAEGDFSIQSDQFALNADNAASLSRIISRAVSNAKWLAPKLASFQQ